MPCSKQNRPAETEEEIRAYWSFREKILLNDDVLYKSYPVIVPGSLRPATGVTQSASGRR